MDEFITLLEKAERLANEWLEFSQKANGWETTFYGDNFIRCYFADDSDYKSLTFGSRIYQKLELSFHSQLEFGGITLRNIKDLPAILNQAEELLRKEQEGFKLIPIKELRLAKEKRKKALLKELAELEA